MEGILGKRGQGSGQVVVREHCLGGLCLAHGVNHIFGGGKIAGTARWFNSLGMKPGIVHAWVASLTEIGSGLLLGLGFLTELGAAGLLGTMLLLETA